jgi:tetratricopeptide (TPR) repeat protein
MDTAAIQRGAELHSQGRLDEAEAAYRGLLDGPPEQVATAHQLLGLLLTDRGDTAGALGHFDAAVAGGGGTADIFVRRGALLRSLGRTRDALDSYDQAIALDADDAETHHLRGMACAALDMAAAALESYDRAIARQPLIKTYWNNRGIVLEAVGRLASAVTSYDRAIALDPDYVLAHHNRGSALMKLERLDEAVASLDEALARNPSIPESWNLRGVALAKLELYALSLASSDKALALRPAYAEAHNNRSVALRALKRFDDALAAADAALAVRPGFSEAMNSRGSALAKLNRYDEAVESYRRADLGLPNDASIQLNLGMALEALGDLPQAQQAFAASEALAPHLPDGRVARSLAFIRAGEIAKGFKLYEARWLQKGGPRHAHPQETLWLGETPLGARRLLVHAEQGFGDVIQFCRFAPLAAPSQQVILQVRPPLKRLMASLQGVGALCDTDETPPAFDVHIPVMSLPLALGLGLGDLSPTIPYLHAEAAAVDIWKTRLPPAHGLRVGLAWTGNPQHDNDHNRSAPLSVFGPLLAEPVQFISLQKDYRPEDEALLGAYPGVLRFEDELKDFADTAALIACCDLVITVDTAVAHLTGALGKPVWLLLPRYCDWRWMNDREDSPWYPTATLFRQTWFGDWSALIARVAHRLRNIEPRA